MDDLGVPPFMETPMYVDVIGWKRAQAKKREIIQIMQHTGA
jgi:hypothetical protein